jgi:hypothetical protein
MGYRGIRKFVAILAAIAVVGGGVGRDAFALTPAEPCHTHHQSASSNDVHPEHRVHAGHEPHGAQGTDHRHDEGNSSVPTDRACFKCCGICTAAPSLNDANAPADIGFVSYLVVYVVAGVSHEDRPLAIDPGIPKRIA